MTDARRDQNFVTTIIGVSSADLKTPTPIAVNPATGAVLIDPTNLDSRYVNVTGDTMTGALIITPIINGTSTFRVNKMAGYEADALPQDSSPAWDKYVEGAGDGITESVSTGILSLIADYSTNDNAWIYYIMPGSNLSSATGYTIEVKLKMETFGSEDDDGYWGDYSTYFDFWDDVGYGVVLIGDGKVTLLFDDNSDYYEMDTSDDYHVYRLTVKDGIAILYIDDVQRIQVSSVTPLGGGASYDMTFGNWFSITGGLPERTGTNESSWDYVYMDTPVLNVDTTNARVGVGTDSPDSAFHIKAGTSGTVGSHPAGQLIIQTPTASVFSNAVITGYDSGGDGNPNQQLWYLGNSSSGSSDIIYLNRRNSKLHLGTNNSTRMTILGSGNVGIANTAPPSKFMVDGDSDIVQTIVQAHSSQTANIVEIQKSDTTVLAQISGKGIYQSDIVADANSFFVANLHANLDDGDRLYVSALRTTIESLNKNNTKSSDQAPSSWRPRMFMRGTSQVTEISAAMAFYDGNDTSVATRAYGYKIITPVLNDTSSIGTFYGFYAEDINNATTNYAIYTNAGLNQLGDQLKIDLVADKIGLIVQAHSSQSANIVEIQDSNAAILSHVNADGSFHFGDASNNLQISAGGILTLEGTAKRWLAVRPDLDYTVITAQGKPTQVVVGVFHGYSMPVYNSDNEELFFNVHVPGRWDEVSNPVVHLLVALAGAEDVSDNFKFQVSWEHLTEGDVIPVTSHDVEVEQAVLTDRNAQYSTYELQFTIDYDVDNPDDLTDHDDLSFRLRRIDATNPDITNEVIILDYHVEFQVDKMFDGDAV